MMKILIAEDNVDSRIFLQKFLEAKGFEVMVAVDGKEALDLLGDCLPDLIISDILMPEMDGYALCRHIKKNEHLKNIPLIFFTATYTDEKSRQFGLSLGACRYIIKPSLPDELLAEIEGVIIETREGRLPELDNFDQDNSKIEKEYSAILARKLDKKIVALEEEQKNLKKSEQKYRQIVESLQDEYFFYSHGIDGIFTYISPAILHILGYSQQEFCHHYNKYLTDSPINKEVEQHTALSICGKKQPAYEVEVFHKNGGIHRLEVSEMPVFDEKGKVVAVDGIAHDITARRTADKTFQTLVESVVGHTGQDLFTTITRGLCELFDCECAILGEYTETTVNTWAMELDGLVVNENSYSLSGSPYENVKKTGFCFYPEKVTELFPEDDTLKKMSAVGYAGIPIFNKEDKAIGILCVLSRKKLVLPDRAEGIMNILQARVAAEIERLNIDNALKKSEGNLVQAQKMEAIGTLAGGIAHDFNNILSAIYGFTELTKIVTTGQEEVQENLDQVLLAAERAKTLIRQILAFSRKTEHEKQIIQISPIVKEALKLLRSSIPATIEIKADIISEASVLADPTQTHQLIMNLCTNAYHAMRETGGILGVSLKEELFCGNHIPQLDITPGRYLILEVSDTGLGMDAETKEKIFDPYFTTKEVGEGTGLGLAVVHGIVQEYKGCINVYSEKGHGTTFHIYLPIIEEEPTDYASVPGKLQSVGGCERIMFVDDERPIVTLAKDMLQNSGYTVSTFTNGVQAWQELQQNADNYDLVITDMTMPYMTGVQLSQKIMEIRPNLPIILCTGHSELTNRKIALAMGITAYCEKPFTIDRLLDTVRRVIDNVK